MNGQEHLHETDTYTNRLAEQTDADAAAASASGQLAAEGARFAQAREAKGWSLGDVSSRMKVPVKKLQALETGDVNSITDTTVFVLGMARSYAKMLDIDAAPFSSLLRSIRGEMSPDPLMPASVNLNLQGDSRTLPAFDPGSTKRGLWPWYIGAVVIAVVATGVWRANQEHHDEPPALLRQAAPASSANVAAQSSGVPAASATQAVDSVASTASVAGNPARASDVSPASTAIVASRTVSGAVTSATGVSASAAQQVAAAVPAASATEITGAATVVVHATQDTWVSVRQKGGKEVFSALVHGGSTQQVSGMAPLKVTLGDALGVGSITLNGRPVDSSKYAAPHGDTVAHFTLP